MPVTNSIPDTCTDKFSENQILLLLSRLREEGRKDDENCRDLNNLTKLLNNSVENNKKNESQSLYKLIDNESLETILSFLDKRKSQMVQSHGILATSTYLEAAGNFGSEQISNFFSAALIKRTSDDYIRLFSVVSGLFPVVPDIISKLFLSEGFVPSLKNLIKKELKLREAEKIALEMLNIACMNTNCREAIRQHCLDWLTETAQNRLNSGFHELSFDKFQMEDDKLVSLRKHSESLGDLAAVILAKLQAVTPKKNPGIDETLKQSLISVEELSGKFIDMLISGSSSQASIEGLAYTSLQPKVKEILASDKRFLGAILNALGSAPIKSPEMFGALSILVNLTSYMPALQEEQKSMNQLKAYADASKLPKRDQLEDDEHVMKRCQSVFEAGVIPTLVTHSQHGSISSLKLTVSIIFSLAKTPKIRGKMAQQGAVKILLNAYSKIPDNNLSVRRITAHALARILITTNPIHVFGGSNPLSITSAVRPLVLILSDDLTVEHRDLLPVFESLLALTNLASTDDTARNPIIRFSFPQIEELLLSDNKMVTRATVELICNLVQSTEGVAKFADGGQHASHRMHILLAMTDVDDLATRRAAGGALASLTQWDTAVNAILERDRGVNFLLSLCEEDQEELRHRGVVCLFNVLTAPGEIGKWGIEKIKKENGADKLKNCLRNSRNQEVLNIAVEALKILLENDNPEAEISRDRYRL